MIKAMLVKNFYALLPALISILAMPSTLQADASSDGDLGIAEYRKGNLIEAIPLLEKSAAQGYVPAQTTLAFILDSAERDAESFHWYQKAAETQDATGLFGLAGMYAKGEGTDKDPRKAGQLIRQAAQLEHVEAMRVYAHALEYGQLGFGSSPHSAAKWYLKAAGLGDEVSMQRLRRAYTQGQLGLPVDTQQAEAWRKKLNQSD
jgi:TPR repeat protein